MNLSLKFKAFEKSVVSLNTIYIEDELSINIKTRKIYFKPQSIENFLRKQKSKSSTTD